MADSETLPAQRRKRRAEAQEEAYQNSRRAAQEAENRESVERGTRLMGEAERSLRRALRRFQTVRVPRGRPERHELRFLVRNLEAALGSIRRAKRGSFLDFSDPDLTMEDPDLET